jgi:hypothetical protein
MARRVTYIGLMEGICLLRVLVSVMMEAQNCIGYQEIAPWRLRRPLLLVFRYLTTLLD